MSILHQYVVVTGEFTFTCVQKFRGPCKRSFLLNLFFGKDHQRRCRCSRGESRKKEVFFGKDHQRRCRCSRGESRKKEEEEKLSVGAARAVQRRADVVAAAESCPKEAHGEIGGSGERCHISCGAAWLLTACDFFIFTLS
jgi:hypothetical protein